MGLISLAYLNKIRDYNYWNNVWDSKLNYNKYLYLTLFLNKYLNLVFSDFSLNLLIKYINNSNLKRGYLLNSFIKKNFVKSYFIGKIWFFKYQKWVIISIKLFNLGNNITSKHNLRKRNQIWVNYNKHLNLKKHTQNYKNKF